jgi:methylmalonyl-CoA mutase N-terminal domain/subunit
MDAATPAEEGRDMAVRASGSTMTSPATGPDAAPGRSISGRPVEVLYEGPAAPLAPPGEYPYTRGIHPGMYRTRLWTFRMFAGFGTPDDTNARFHRLLAQGQTGLSTAFDMPTLMGYDPDHPLSEGEVGREGVSVAHVGDMRRLFAGIDLGEVSTSMTISGPAPVVLALFVAAAEESGVPRERLRGTTQTDILKEFIAQKEWIVPERPSMRLVGDLIEFCTDEMPGWYPVSVSGYHIREAGATAAQELAFTLADGVAYAEHLAARGIEPDRFLPRFSFFFNAHIDFFEEVAKLRAARRLWASLMRERLGASDPRSWQLRTHVQTSGVSLAAQQPLVNIARTAIEALAGVLGGAQSLHTNSYDETLSLPTEHAAGIALRTQQVIAHETGAASTADPLGGSYYVEKLTDDLEAEAREYIRRIDERGGMVAAVEEGYPQAEIAEAAYRFQRDLEAGDRKMIGVNAFAEADEDEIELHRPDPAAERQQAESVRAHRASRDAAACETALAALRRACEGEDNVMPHLVEAARKGATLGEMCDTFRAVWGAYRDPARW